MIKELKNGGVGIMSTDTVYGLVGSALNEETVKKIYRLKKRNPKKPFIILIHNIDSLLSFGIHLDNQSKSRLREYWPGPVSVILPCPDNSFKYLHRGTESLAFRIPSKKTLKKVLAKTGPLVAPSANPEGLSPAKNVKEARNYFGANVDFYKSGHTTSSPSKIVKLLPDKIEIVRE